MARRTPALALAALFSAHLHAQSTPPPSGAIPPPLTGYVGRYLDSAQTREFQGAPTRTLRARLVKVAPERGLILMAISGTVFGVYNLPAFADRAAHEPLSTGGHGEKFLPPDVFSVDAEHQPGWVAPLSDGQDRLFDFDYDDRGLFYLAYSVYGLGIVDSSGALVKQVIPAAVLPLRVLAVRTGAGVFAVVSDPSSSATAVYDVTTPSTPALVQTFSFGIQSYAKLASGAVAVVTSSGALRIYATAADLVAGNAPAQTFTPQLGFSYVLTATDGVNVFAAQSSLALMTILSKLEASGGGFAETRYAPVSLFPADLHYGAGYVVLSGSRPGARAAVFIYPRDSSTPADLTAYFSNAYPPTALIAPQSFAPYQSAGQTYLIAALYGVGDLFSMAQAADIPALSPVALIALMLAVGAIAVIRLR